MDLKEAYRALDPSSPVEADSEYYVSRPENPVSRIITELQLTDATLRYALTGHRGTGKTTELKRISKQLGGEFEIHYITVMDFDPFAELFSGTQIRITDATNPKINYFSELIHLLRPRRRSTILLIDGIDKLDDDAAQQCLLNISRSDLRNSHVVCVTPLHLSLSRSFERFRLDFFDTWHFLPCMPLWTPDGERLREGWDQSLAVIERRAPVFSDDALELLIEAGAGIHRELLRLAQQSCVFAATANATEVGNIAVSRAVNETRNEYGMMLTMGDIELLKRVDADHRITGDVDMLRLIQHQFVIAYEAADVWFSVHPIVRSLIDSYPELDG